MKLTVHFGDPANTSRMRPVWLWLLVLLCFWAPAVLPGQDLDQRTWTDVSGRHTLQASFVAVRDGRVALKRRDGSITVLPLTKLSLADRQWIRNPSARATQQDSPASSAKFAFRLGKDPTLLDQYAKHPDDYPTCRQNIDLMHFDSQPVAWKRSLFETNRALIEIGTYDKKSPGYTGTEVVRRIQSYERHGWDVWGIFVYREEWLNRPGSPPGQAGPFEADLRILSPEDLQNVRQAIAQSDLKCRDTLKIIQLIGGRTHGQRGDSWLRMPKQLSRHFLQFDGVGIECHIGDHEATKPFPDGPATLRAMAAMTRWAAANDKTSFVFMGGAPHTYEDLGACKATYRQLWSEMRSAGVAIDDPCLVYFRQGARAGKHTPESNPTTLTHQKKWVIDQLRPSGRKTSSGTN